MAPGLRAKLPGASRRRGGFTLLELILAVTVLTVFLLPMMVIIARSKARAVRYTQQREVRDLAQRKLFDRIHFYELQDHGDFTAEGRPSWTWTIDPPQMMGQSEQVLLQYTIRVEVPQNLDATESSGGTQEKGSTYQLSFWTFPDARWYEEQDVLYSQGQPTLLYGDPALTR